MNRRSFITRSLSALGGILAAPVACLLPNRLPDPLDGQWHKLMTVNGKAFLDGVPWAKPWLGGNFNAAGGLFLWANGSDSPVTVEFDWASCMKPHDGSGPEVFETRFKASRSDRELIIVGGWEVTA